MGGIVVTSLRDQLRRRGSDRLANLPVQFDCDGSSTYQVMDVIPSDLSAEQLDDLAIRLSGFLEDLNRLHVDSRASVDALVGAMAPPLSIPLSRTPSGERKTACMLHLCIPPWRGLAHLEQVARIDLLARNHGLRCVRAGTLPQEGE